MYEYNSYVRAIIDGDTIEVDIDLGFDVTLRKVRVRIDGIDAPEIRGNDMVEKHWGRKSRAFLEKTIPVGTKLIFVSKEYHPHDSFGRVIGDFYFGLSTISKIMLNSHHAVPWTPDKEERERNHLRNRELLVEAGYSPAEE